MVCFRNKCSNPKKASSDFFKDSRDVRTGQMRLWTTVVVVLLTRMARSKHPTVLLTGQLRISDREHLDAVKAMTNGTYVVIVTTPAYAGIAADLVRDRGRYCVVEELPKVTSGRDQWILSRPWLNQHRDLDIALRLIPKDTSIVIRGRTDVRLRSGDAALRYRDLVASKDAVHAASDLIFYANRKVFLSTFTDFYPSLAHGNYSKRSTDHAKYCPTSTKKSSKNIYSRYADDLGCTCKRDWDDGQPKPEHVFAFHVQSRHRRFCKPLCTTSLQLHSAASSSKKQESKVTSCPVEGQVEPLLLGSSRKERRDFHFHTHLPPPSDIPPRWCDDNNDPIASGLVTSASVKDRRRHSNTTTLVGEGL